MDPYPDAWLEGVADRAPGPEARYELVEAVRLAFVATIQHLPPRQRAVLVLRDVLGWSAQEAAALLGFSVAAANSALQQARETLDRQGSRPVLQQTRPCAACWTATSSPGRTNDIEPLVSTLRDDAVYSRPPRAQWYVGPPAIAAFHQRVWSDYAGQRLRPIGANRQPAFAMYARTHPGEPFLPHSIQLLTLAEDGIRAMTCFVRPLGPQLFPAFGLPESLT